MCSPSDVLGEINPYENHEEGVKLNKRPKSAPSRLLRIGSSSLTDSNEVTSPSQAHLRENSVGPSEAGLHINNSSSGNGNNATGVSTIENACCKPRPIFQTYFDIEFVFCQSPFSIGFELPFQFQLLQNAMFWTLVVLASFDTFRELKQELASSNMKDEFHRIAEVGFIAVEFVTRLYFVKMVTFHQKSILGVLECLRELQAWKYQLDIHKDVSSWRVTTKAILIGLIPLIGALLWGMFGYWQLNKWNLAVILYDRAIDVGTALLVWGRNEPQREITNMQTNILDNSDAVWIGLGIIGILCRIAKNMLDYATRHLMIILAISLKTHTDTLIAILKKSMIPLNVSPLTPSEALRQEITWNYYFHVRKSSQVINQCFGVLMKLTHACNLLTVVYFVLQIEMSQHTTISFCLYLYEVALILTFNFIASQVAEANDVARHWIKRNTAVLSAGLAVVDGTTLQVLLDDIRHTPIGIGTGAFFMGEHFIQKLLGLMTSLLFYMIQAEQGLDVATTDEEA